MKKIICLFLISTLSIFLIFTSFANCETASSKVDLSVTLNSITCLSNNHVGNEWSFTCTVNKASVTKGSTIKFSATNTDKISITAKAVEADTYPDTNTKSLSIPVSKLKEGGNTYSLDVTVTENRGRYSGNTATWEFSFTVKKISAIKTQTIIPVPNDKVRNGEDKYTWADGSKYSGNWANNEIDGEGVLSFANGDKYAGHFDNNKKSGNGTYIWANGEIYTGEWSGDTMSGSGVYTFLNGDKYDGKWDSGFMNGNGIYTFKDGTKLTGIWVDNQYSSED